MQPRHKILLVDDDQDLLTLYQQILAQLPTQPEISTADNGARAVAMLESEPFELLICDLKMPKMDGLQLLSIVRRRYPMLRTVVLTSMLDEEFRARAYSIGVDLFWFKPGNKREINLFLECIESLLGRAPQTGFRGVQDKSLVDLIQLECLSKNSLVLRVTNGPLVGKIWIQDGEVVDAVVEDLTGEVAFKGILTWKTGSFETLPAEPERARAIGKGYNALLLETVQAIDEAQLGRTSGQFNRGPHGETTLPLALLSRLDGAEFVLVTGVEEKAAHESRGLENPEHLARWSRQTLQRFGHLADQLHAGQLQQVECLGPRRSAGLAANGEHILCMGWHHSFSADTIRDKTRKALRQWIS